METETPGGAQAPEKALHEKVEGQEKREDYAHYLVSIRNRMDPLSQAFRDKDYNKAYWEAARMQNDLCYLLVILQECLNS